MLKPMNRLMFLCVAAFSAVLMMACGPVLEELPDVPKSDRETQSKDNRDFAVSFYQKIALPKSDTNLFFSPYSISSALGMVSAGAKGQTASEIEKAMRFSLPQEKLHPAFAWLTIDLNNRGKMGDFELSVANRIWGQKDYGFNQDFTKLLEQRYKAGLAPMDFKSKPEAERKVINDWVTQQTQGKIKDLMPQGSVSQATRLVLTNAIYFKGNWAEQFKKSATQPGDFAVTKDNKVQTSMMSHTFKEEAQFADLPEAKVLELPYKGKTLSMVLVLPKTRHELAKLEKALTREKLDTWISKLDSAQVEVRLPKFKLETKLDLKPILDDMGMKNAFTPAADFSGMYQKGEESLMITDAVHKAFVAVDEEGTEAAAATGIGMGVSSAPDYPKFIADQPFLFLIRDRSTGSILFMGRFAKPTPAAQ